MTDKSVLVVGAGVSGLSSALLLRDAGYEVTIWAKNLTADTTSSKAAAFWYPYLCNPREKAIAWSKATYQYLENNILNDPKSGTHYIMFTEYMKEKTADPWWRPAVDIFERPTSNELPEGYVDGYRTKAIVMDTSSYLPWLIQQLEDRGVKIIQKELKDFHEAFEQSNIVINCTGLGSKQLCNDDKVFPVRGQVLRVKPNGFKEVVADENSENLTYIIPRLNDIIVGGTAQENDWNLQADPNDTAEILRKIKSIVPQFETVEVLEEKVGLRPARDEVRLELESIGDKTLVHNYGHGGAGFTLSWGCAQEVTDLVKKVVSE